MNLKQFRAHIGLSQNQAAEKLGIAQTTYGQWETGKRKPSSSTLIKICKAFNCTVTIDKNGLYFTPNGQTT